MSDHWSIAHIDDACRSLEQTIDIEPAWLTIGRTNGDWVIDIVAPGGVHIREVSPHSLWDAWHMAATAWLEATKGTPPP